MSTTPSERTQQRRRLLKTAAAAPAIFVLPTGAALAASSSTCVARMIPPSGEPWNKDNLPPGNWVFEATGNLDGDGKPLYQLAKLTSTESPNFPNAPAVQSCWNSMTGTSAMLDGNGVLVR